MSFDTTVITEVFPPQFRGGQMVLRWRSSAPPDSWYQVYVAGVLAWYGQATSAALDPPDGHAHVDIGRVADGEQTTDFSSSLAPIANRARLTWVAGPGQAADIEGFHVYCEHSPGLGINYSDPVATVTAVDQGIESGGYGMGGYGDPGYGSIAGTYRWTSGALTRGSWLFAVRSFDSAGNEANGLTTTVAISTPPRPPAVSSTEPRRLTYTYDAGTRKITLNWLASPG